NCVYRFRHFGTEEDAENVGDYTVTRLRRNRNRWGCALSVEKSSAAKNAAQNPGSRLRNTPKLARGGHFSGTFCRRMPLNHN
ncbi:hypothetical protein, partial [Pantoea sp. Pa-EAmG]|uniref:hypothetical protein n=1 Tax=Pantoea sp. Pa-EAmG TaxID=3043311 RepID=UPI0024AF571F